MKKDLFTLCLAIIFFISFSSVIKAQVVFLPLEDLFQGPEGINLSITQEIIKNLKNRGIDVIPLKDVLDFLAQNRIRWTGWIDKVTAFKIAQKFHAELIFLGTVTERKENPPCLGLSMRGIQIPNYKLIWSRTIVVSGQEEVSLLDINHLGWENVVAKATSSLLAHLPEDVGLKISMHPEVEVTDIFVPKRVKTQEKIEGAVRLYFFGPLPSYIAFIFKEKKIPLQKKGSGVYAARWEVEGKDGSYPLRLCIIWPRKKVKKIITLTHIYIDNTPPLVRLLPRRGEKRGDIIFFKDSIVLKPIMENPEPIARWCLKVYSSQGELLAKEERIGPLPKTFVWKPTSYEEENLLNKRYKIVLKIWDLAGNLQKITQQAYLLNKPPVIRLLAEEKEGYIIVNLFKEKHLVPIVFWHLNVTDKEGNVLNDLQGEKDIPSAINLPYRKRLLYSLEVQDILGNKYKVYNKSLKPLLLRTANKKMEEKKWIEDF